MSVSLLLLTHDRIGATLVESASSAFEGCPMPYVVMSATRNDDPEDKLAEARQHVQALNTGDGVLVLTDVFGATPCNIASRLLDLPGVVLVTGLNLAMLIKVFNYHYLSLDGLAEKAVKGGMDSVFEVIRDMVPNGDQ